MQIKYIIFKNRVYMYDLRYHIIEEILSHALRYFPKIDADPEENEVLSKLGNLQVNFHRKALCS